ncbi:hypothetical protein [Paenisporosarcina antarctica]|uniref:Uncharacterized protein n=1 Tax=Paenisporosarcina antarctica TaxID=417367 RepID=A0A4P7A050_9BACL|nr:hypothetical protein [Paenisporosarcina antarctica]QBP41938.1 hypothetical protein E2636_12595 [Paenisporosarcina antarctica]
MAILVCGGAGKYGLLVENSVGGLVQGLRSIANKENIDIIEKFDYNQYNLKAMETFYNCIK